MSKRKKTTASPPEPPENDSVTTRAVVPPEIMKAAMGDAAVSGETELDHAHAHDEHGHGHGHDEHGHEEHEPMPASVEPIHAEAEEFDAEMTVNLVGDLLPGRDDLDEPTVSAPAEALEDIDRLLLQRKHLRGLLESLVFASDSPIKPNELAKLASAPV